MIKNMNIGTKIGKYEYNYEYYKTHNKKMQIFIKKRGE